MAKEIELTQDGYDALVKELEYLKTEKRREIAEKIKVARGYGDLSENAEYDAAKDEQGHVEQRIMELERTVKNAKIMNKGAVTKGTVSVGTKVTVVDEDGDEETYSIVGSTEYDPLNGKISDDSPVGRALKGHKTGETVTVELPTGKTMQLTIKKVVINR